MRIRRALAALLSLAVGLFIFMYRGPGWRPVRHTLGDVIVTPFLIFTLLAFSGMGRGRAVIGVCVFAFAVEAAQLMKWTRPDDPWWVQITFGSTADPLDLLAYAVGCGLAYAVDRWLLQPSAAGPRGPSDLP